MSIRRITPDDVEHFTLETHPPRFYSSGSTFSSTPNITGTLYIFPRRSDSEKEVQPLSAFSSSLFNDQNLGQLLIQAKTFASISSSNTAQINGYLSGVFSQQPSARKQQTVDIIRFTPPFSVNTNTFRKLVTINDLMPYYRSTQPNSQFAFTNYNCFNFFTSSAVPTGSVVLYPNAPVSGVWAYGPYTPTGSWSIDFWINPKYTTDTEFNSFKAGTVMHLSGVLGVSLVTGSSRDLNGYPNAYRILVQLSSSAGTAPSLATTNSLTFYSSDNSLKRNNWHHITIRHGGPAPLYNNGTGSILIDGRVDTEFVLTTSIASTRVTGGYAGSDGPIVLALGNYYEGTNAGTSGMSRFFAADVSDRDGLEELDALTGVDYPTTFAFNHPLNAEIHDLKIFNKYLTVPEISGFQSAGPTNFANLMFYVPPFFTIEAPTQSFVGSSGGVLVTPFQTKNDTTRDPFNVTMSFGIGGMYMNLENYGKEFVQNKFPRWLTLTGSTINATSDIQDANQFLFATESNRRRQYTIMPCDNGQFVPNFGFLATGSNEKFRNDLGNLNYGFVSLRNMVPLKTRAFGLSNLSGSIVDGILGPTPNNLSGSSSDSLAILHRTRDNTSNQVVFFDVSNLYYGNRIRPGSLLLEDTSMSGSGGKVKVSLKDDGYGNLYRGNADTAQASWSSVGNVFYNEGIIMIKSPQLFFFGQENWQLKFDGEQNVHVLKFNLLLPPLTATSSSNPSYVSASNNPLDTLANEIDEQYVWLSGLYLHDDNLNVITKTSFAQPIIKRTGDKLMFAVKLDL